jgi:ribosomal protein S18 acetylase RimI-like enzyme
MYKKLENYLPISYSIHYKGNYFTIEATKNKHVIGQLECNFIGDSEHIFVSNLYVEEHYRKNGVATKLNLELLKNHQCYTLLCNINKDNNIMKKLLTKLGWQRGFSMGNKIYMIYKKGN